MSKEVVHLKSKLQPLRTACRTALVVKGKTTQTTTIQNKVTCSRCKDTDEYKFPWPGR